MSSRPLKISLYRLPYRVLRSLLVVSTACLLPACRGVNPEEPAPRRAHFYLPDGARGTYYLIGDLPCGLTPKATGDTLVYSLPAQPGIVLLNGPLPEDCSGRAFFLRKPDCKACRLIDCSTDPNVAQDGSDTAWARIAIIGAWRNNDAWYAVPPSPKGVASNTGMGYHTIRVTICTYDSLRYYPDSVSTDSLQTLISAAVRRCKGG